MTSAISGVSSMVNSLFSKIDTKNAGYIDKAGLQSAFDQISTSDTSDSASVDTIFTTLDSDSDGKITKSEMTTGLTKLAAELDSQFNQSRLGGASSTDTSGYTKDELSSLIQEIGDTDSQRTTLMSSIVSNFDTVDTDGNGKVSDTEAMAYDQSLQASSTTSSNTVAAGGMPPPPPPPPSGAASSGDSTSSTSYEAADTNQDGVVSSTEQLVYDSQQSSSLSDSLSVMKKIMQLAQAYGITGTSSSEAASSSISAIA